MPWFDFKKNKQRDSKEEKKLEDHLREKELERQKLRNEELEFEKRKRDRERRIIEIEKEELEKRENEVRRRSSDLDELRRGHRAVEDKLEGQIKELKMQLEDKRLAHNSEEQEVEYELRGQKEKMNELRRSLNRRIEEFGELDLLSPSSTSFSTGSSSNQPPAQIYLTSPASASSLCSQYSTPSAPSLLDLSAKRSTEDERQTRRSDPQPIDAHTNTRSRIRAASQSSHHLAAPAMVYPTVPDDEPMEASAILPSVPQGDPGEDSYATLKPQKSSKKKPVLESVD